MIRKLKNTLKLTTLLLLTLFTGCTQEKDYVNENNHSKLKIENKSFQEVLNIPIFNKSYQRLAQKKGKTSNSQEAKTALENEYNFTIVESSPVKVITDTESTSYVLLIERAVDENLKFENLIINIKNDEMIASILKYTLSEKATYEEQHQSYKINIVETSINVLATESKVSDSPTCIRFTSLMCNAVGNGYKTDHIADSDCITFQNGLYELETTFCFSSGGASGGSFYTGGNNQGTTGGWTPTNNGPGTHGGGFGNSVNTMPVLELSEIDPLASNFIANLDLSPEENAWLNNHFSIKLNVIDYLGINHTQTDYDFVNEAIDALRNGGEVDFDNGVILDSSFLLNAKAICVYNKLKTSSTFKDIFANVFDATKKPFIILKTNNLSGNADGGTVGTCVPTNGNHLLNTIEIDTDLIADGHPLQIAKTIAHEFIHAFLNIKLFNAGLGMSIPAISNLDFIQAVNTYYNDFSDGQDQHNFMYNFMIPTLQSILSEIKDLCVTPTNNANMLDLSVYIPLNTSPGAPFIWHEYFKNLALAGLQDCNFFHSEIGNIDNNGNVISTIDQAKMQSFNQYNMLGRINLLKNCN